MTRTPSEKFEQEQNSIVKYIFEGLSNEQIAKKMHYSRSTISYRINILFAKYYASNRRELVLAIMAKLVGEKKKKSQRAKKR